MDVRTGPTWRTVVVVSAGVAGVAASYATVGSTPEFVAAPLVSLLVNAAPGAAVTFGITTLGDLAQPLVGAFGLLLTVALLAVVALLADGIGRRASVRYVATGVGATASGTIAFLLTASLTSAVAAAVGVAATLALAERRWEWGVASGAPASEPRRGVLKAVAGVGAFGLLAYLLGRREVGTGGGGGGGGVDGVGGNARSLAQISDEETAAEAERLVSQARSQSLDVPGMDSLVTDAADFYEVDVNVTNPNPYDAEYTLSVTGDVELERTYTYEDLLGEAFEHRYATLRCVGDPVNGKKMDNALWTGIPVSRLLDDAGVPDNCCVMLRAVDDYYEEFPLDALREGFLAFGMNGQVLPRGHGYPVRALVPGHWGEVNVKWVSEIEVLSEPATGYWEKRGWHGTGPVNTVAKLHATNHLDDGRVQVGGHAYAGTRGVERVEVSVDGGETWADATLSDPLPDPDTWRMWEYTYEPSGEHEVVVRATDGTGAVQPRDQHGAFPSGATGWVSKTIPP